jgi:hypothetical protein
MQLVRMYTPRGLERDMGFVLGKPNYFVHTPPTRGRAVLAHVWADCRQFGRVELKVKERLSVLSAVSVISQDCDDVFWHSTRRFPFQSQVHTSVSITNCHVSQPLVT